MHSTTLCGYSATWVSLGITACADPAPAPIRAPPEEFAAQGVVIEHVHDDQVTWRADVEAMNGDLNAADVVNVRIEYLTGETAQPIQIHAQRGHLSTKGWSVLHDIQIDVPSRGRLLAPRATHQPDARRVIVAGPVVFRGPVFEARATQAEISLPEERIDLRGPIVGSLHWDTP